MVYMTKKTVQSYKKLLEGAGFTPDDWQAEVVALAEKYPLVGVSIPRQNGKTEVALMLLMITGMRGQQGAFFAHNGDLSRAALRRMATVCKNLEGTGIVKKVSQSGASNFVEFSSGGYAFFRIRTPGAAVGLTLDRVIYDEAQKMDAESYEAISPVVTTSPNASTVMLGTPPTNDDLAIPNAPFLDLRRRAKEIPKQAAWIEYGIGDYRKKHTRWTLATAKAANPSWRRIKDFQALTEREYATLGEQAYARQRLGAWVLPEDVEQHDPYLKVSQVRRILTKNVIQDGHQLYASVGLLADAEEAFVAFSDGHETELVARIPMEGGSLGEVVRFLVEKSRRYRSLVIPATARGRALFQMLEEHHMQKKAKLSGMPQTATQIQLMRKKIENNDLKIYDSDWAYACLSSFWIGYDDRNKCQTIESADSTMASGVLAIALVQQEEKIRPETSANTAQSGSWWD